jgi:hypothetical protein
VTEAWLRENVAPNMQRSEYLSQQVTLVMALPILCWATFDAAMVDSIPAEYQSSIRDAFMQIQHELPDGENPVRKIPLIVTGQDDQIQIDGIF